MKRLDSDVAVEVGRVLREGSLPTVVLTPEHRVRVRTPRAPREKRTKTVMSCRAPDCRRAVPDHRDCVCCSTECRDRLMTYLSTMMGVLTGRHKASTLHHSVLSLKVVSTVKRTAAVKLRAIDACG